MNYAHIYKDKIGNITTKKRTKGCSFMVFLKDYRKRAFSACSFFDSEGARAPFSFCAGGRAVFLPISLQHNENYVVFFLPLLRPALCSLFGEEAHALHFGEVFASGGGGIDAGGIDIAVA